MSAEELAPSSVKKFRDERQSKYFKEQVFMKEETKIITKNHKGESILTIDDSNISFPVITEKASTNQKLSSPKEKSVNNDEYAEMMEINEEFKESPMEKTQKENKSEIKYKNLNQEQINFYLQLEEYQEENLIKKLHDKLRTNLKPSTYEEIMKIREEKRKISLI